MDSFVLGFLKALLWLPLLFGGWLVKKAFTSSLDLGE